MLDKQVQEKQRAKVQQQQDKVQDAQDLAAALRQHKLDEAKSTAARRAAALKSKALMANQVCFLLQLLLRLWNVPLEEQMQLPCLPPQQVHINCKAISCKSGA